MLLLAAHVRPPLSSDNTQRPALIVVEPEPLALELLLQDAVLLDEVRDHVQFTRPANVVRRTRSG